MNAGMRYQTFGLGFNLIPMQNLQARNIAWDVAKVAREVFPGRISRILTPPGTPLTFLSQQTWTGVDARLINHVPQKTIFDSQKC